MMFAIFMVLFSGVVDLQDSAEFYSPYGKWSTERGQTIEVKRGGGFVYCDAGACRAGRYKVDGLREVLLLDFVRMPITQRLMHLSGEDEARALNVTMPLTPERRFGFDLGDGGMSPEFRNRLCQDRPCRIIGRVEGDIYRFVKIENY